MSTNNLLDNLKGLDDTGLPPCQSELTAHVNRSAFIARMWAHANQNNIDPHPKQHDGWDLENDSYTVRWFEGQQLPDKLVPEDSADIEDSDDDFNQSSDIEAGYLDSNDEIITDSE